MDKEMFKAVDEFIKNHYENNKKVTLCPKCKTSLEMIQNGSSYEVKCQTKNCLREVFRGI